VSLVCVVSRCSSAIVNARLTERHTRRTETKVGYSDPMVLNGKAIAQRIKGTGDNRLMSSKRS